jgi:hypothetical protein
MIEKNALTILKEKNLKRMAKALSPKKIEPTHNLKPVTEAKGFNLHTEIRRKENEAF